MFFSERRHDLTARAANRAASAGGERFQNSKFANTVLAPIVANRLPYVITPYLGLRAKLSQVWINRWTILLLLCLVRTLIAIATLHDDIKSARKEALSACSGVEAMGSAMASMPHYMSQGVNEMTAKGIEHAVHGLMSMINLTITGVEEIVVFYIHLLTSTYLCLFMLVARGSLHAAVELIEGASDFLNSTIKSVGDDIHNAVGGFQSTVNDIVNTLNDLDPFGDHDVPTLDISQDLNKLYNLKIPSTVDAELEQLQKNMPTFNEVQEFADKAIQWPFEQLKHAINEALPNYQFDRSVFPVPEKHTLTFCSDNNGINDFFNSLVDLNILARKVAISVLVILAALVCLPMAYREVRRHRKMEERAQLVDDKSCDNMDVVYLASRPMSSTAGMKLGNAFKATRRQHLVRWAIAYATTVPALFVLSLGVAGLFSCLCRYLLLVAVQKEVPELTHEISSFAGKVVTQLDHASATWANSTNDAVLKINKRVNDDVFGWVNTSTHAVNHTLNVFIDESINVINITFGGTILYEPVKELFNCLIGMKVNNIEKGLTWVHEHAHIDFPLLPNDTFSLGAAASLSDSPDAQSFLADPSGGASDAITGAVDAITNRMEHSIRIEAFISTGLVCVWVIVALIGIFRALSLFYGKGHMPDTRYTKPLPNSSRTTPSPPPPPVIEKTTAPGNPSSCAAYTLKPRPFTSFDADNVGALSPIQEDGQHIVGYAGERGVRANTKRQPSPSGRRSAHADVYGAPDAGRDRFGGMRGQRNDDVTFDRLGH